MDPFPESHVRIRSHNQKNILSGKSEFFPGDAAEVLKEMYSAFVPASSEMYSALVDMSDAKKFTDEDIREFALELQEAIDNSPQIVSEYTRHLLSVGLDEFAQGKRPNARKLVNDVLAREEKRLEEYTRRVRGDEFPYK